MAKIFIKGPRIILRTLKPEDATARYAAWLNDPVINRYLEIRFRRHTVPGIRKYIKEVSGDKDTVFLAIMLGKLHIGNIKLGPIDNNHRVGDIGIVIGEKSCWGKGYATEAVKLLSDYAFRKLKLHKLTAGAYLDNVGSSKAFLKAGFFEEGIRRKHFRCGGKWIDEIMLAKINNKIHA